MPFAASAQTAPPTANVSAQNAPMQSAERPLRTSPLLNQIDARLRDKPLRIEDAVAIALAANRNLAFAQEALLRASGRTLEARAAYNPTLSVSPGYVFQDNKLEPQALFGVTLPIDISGLIRAATDQAKFQEIGYRLAINRARNQAVADTKAAFYDALRAQALVRVANEDVADTLERLSDAQKKLQARAVTRYDVIRAETDAAAARQQAIRARNLVQRSLGLLSNAMGIDILTPLRLDETGATELPPGVLPPESNPPALQDMKANPANGLPAAPLSASESAPPLPDIPAVTAQDALQSQGNPPSVTPPNGGNPAPNLPPNAGNSLPNGLPSAANPAGNLAPASEDLGPEFQIDLKEALGTRPEILEADSNIAAAQRGILLARRTELPTFGLSAGYYNERNSTGTTRIDDPRAFVGINIPLFDGGISRARSREARADVSTAQTNRRQSVDFVTLEVQQAYLNLTASRDAVAVANQGLSQARQGFALARVRYAAGVSARAGISPLLEVSDAQVALTLAESNQVNALYDYNNARAQLDRAMGRFAYAPNTPGYAAPLPEGKLVPPQDIK